MSITHWIDKKPLIVIENLLTPSECKDLIAYMDSQKQETISSIGISYYRVILVSNEWAERIYSRIYHLLPKGYREDVSINTNVLYNTDYDHMLHLYKIFFVS